MKNKTGLLLVIMLVLFTSCENRNISSNSLNNNNANSTVTGSTSSISTSSSGTQVNNKSMDASNRSLSMNSDIIQNDEIVNSRVQSILSKATQKDYKTLTIKKMSKFNFERKYLDFTFNYYFSHLPSLTAINTETPMECIRRTGENSAYVIYQTEIGGLLYLFFNSAGTNQDWWLNCSIYSLKKLSYENFKSVVKGTDISLVESIDPATSIQADLYNLLKENSFTTRHLLTDGVLTLDFKKDSAEQCKVTEIHFYKNFKIPADHTVYDYTILPQDYIH